MTDKQIIICGCDVSVCEWYSSTYFKPCDGCKNTPNCYYKQLKRKEQECEELKKIIDEAKNRKLDLNSFFAIEVTVGEYQLELDQLKAENEKLKQTITEIKEIAKHCMKQDICTTCDYSEKCHIEDEEIPTYDVCKLILQKISEVVE